MPEQASYFPAKDNVQLNIYLFLSAVVRHMLVVLEANRTSLLAIDTVGVEWEI